MPRRHKNPTILFGLAAIVAAFTMAAGLFFWRGGPAWCWWLAAVNLVAFAMYGLDKRAAAAGRLRTPEIVLLGLALLGGAVGAYVGMQVFRHKTQKVSFRVSFWLIVACQAGAVIWYVTHNS